MCVSLYIVFLLLSFVAMLILECFVAEDEHIAPLDLVSKDPIKSKWDDEDVDENDVKDSWEDEDEPAPV